VQNVALEPGRIDVLGAERGGDAAVGGHRALAVLDERHDDPRCACPDRPDEVDAALGELSCHELAGRVVAPSGDAAGLRAELGTPRGDVRSLSAGPRRALRPDVVAPGEGLLQPHDHVEQHVAERHDPDRLHWHNRTMDGDDRRGRARSFLLGGLLGASAALATARRRRSAARRREARLTTPAGLAAFEGAPCFAESPVHSGDEPQPR